MAVSALMIHSGALRILDVVAQIIEHVILGFEVRLEIFVGQHVFQCRVIEIVGLHELVVEIERESRARRGRSLSGNPSVRSTATLAALTPNAFQFIKADSR